MTNFIYGTYNDDILFSSLDNDLIYGSLGNDTADFSNAAGSVVASLKTGYASNDGDGSSDILVSIENITGSSNSDSLTGGYNNNYLSGGAGDDILASGAGNDTLDGGAGNDTADFSNAAGSVVASLKTGYASNDGDGSSDVLVSIENITGSSNADSLTGDSGNNLLLGNSGNDYINGMHSDDTINGGDGNDILSGWVGDDSINGGNGDDKIIGGSGYDTLIGDAGNDYLNGYNGDDILNGGSGADKLKGGAGADIFVFDEFSDSGVTTSTRDRIFDFSQTDGDKIDLSALGGFDFIGDATLSSLSIGGELRYETQTFSNGYERTLLQADANGDGVVDMEIQFSQSLIDFTVDDFIF